jgi:hypothetical protein
MQLSAYIKALEELRSLKGDLEVDADGFYGRISAPYPRLAHRKILSTRERKQEFYAEWTKEESKRGLEVVRV